MEKILFIAGFPPPASGQLIMQKKMYDLFPEKDKELIDLNFTSQSREFSKASPKKIFRLLQVVLGICKKGLFEQGRIRKVYYSLSGPKKNALVKDILIGLSLNLFFKKKLVLQVHAGGYNNDFVESRFLFNCLKKVYANVDQLLCLTEYQQKELHFIKAKKKSIVYNFCEDATRRNDWPEHPETQLKLLCVGHINENKGIVECLHLAKVLKDDGIDFSWKFIGAFRDFLFEEKVMKMIRDFQLEKNIIILNEIANDLVYPEYAAADFLLFLSNGPEGQPVVLIEALMVARSVIIAKDISGINEYIKDGYNGFLVDHYKQAYSIITRKRDLSAIKANARQTYLQLFTEEVFANAIGKIFETEKEINIRQAYPESLVNTSFTSYD